MTTPNYETPAERTAIQTINYTIGLSSLGLVLVAGTPKGICAILLGSKEHSLVGQLRSTFPKATPHKDGKELDELLSPVIQLIETPNVPAGLPLDIYGTDFQKRVWEALRKIPAGQTVTYKEVASRVGGTAQEVGEACAANVIAIAIPCHRVVRSDGGVAGYRWGVSRKKLLLQREQELAPDPASLFASRALLKGRSPF
jgi:AraC family transcriptional regulator of adaptative response/methylated-DNA-[protein]-cysteine methyltransferase